MVQSRSLPKWKRKYEETEQTQALSPLAQCLLELFSSGLSDTPLAATITGHVFMNSKSACLWFNVFLQIKAPTIQRIALAAQNTYISMHSAPDVDYIASLGTYGKDEQNIARELINKFCKSSDSILPEPYIVNLPVQVKVQADCEKKVEFKEFYMFLPHQWFALVDAPDHIWRTVFGVHEVEKFWDGHALDKDPKLYKNDIMKVDRNCLPSLVPLSLHGDGGAFSKQDSLLVVSMRAITSASNVSHSQLFLAGIPKTCINKSTDPAMDTMTCLWNVLKWSFTALFEGIHPAVDHNNQPWHDQKQRYLVKKPLNGRGIRGCIFALTGDLEYFQNELHVKAYSFTKCCWLCKAEKTDTIPFNDFRPTSEWRSTVHSPEFHRAHLPSEHPIWSIPCVVTESIHIDSLHTNEEGTAAHTLGNLFFDLVVGSEWHGTQAEKLQMLFNNILKCYSELGTDRSNQISNLTMGNFCNPKQKHTNYPCISGIKARHVRYLVPVARKLCEDALSKGGTPSEIKYRRCRFLCVKWLDEMYTCMDKTAAYHYSQDEHAAYSRATLNFLACYTKLAKISYESRLMKWNIVPKFHYCAHMPAQAEFLNPKFVTTYAGETMVGFMVQLGHSCLNGTPAYLVSKAMCWKIRLAMHLRLHNTMGDE